MELFGRVLYHFHVPDIGIRLRRSRSTVSALLPPFKVQNDVSVAEEAVNRRIEVMGVPKEESVVILVQLRNDHGCQTVSKWSVSAAAKLSLETSKLGLHFAYLAFHTGTAVFSIFLGFLTSSLRSKNRIEQS